MENLTLDALLQSINEESSVNFLIQSSPVCHKIFDPDLKLRFMSKSGVTALQIENIETYYGHTFPTDSAPKNTRDIFNKHILLAAKGETSTIEYSFNVNGNVVWYRTTLSPFFNTDGHLIYIKADSMDITSTKKTEETNRTLLETTEICLKEIHVHGDQDYTLMFMSPAGKQHLCQTSIEELYGKAYPPDFYPDKTKTTITKALDTAVSTGKPTQVEIELFDTCGNSVWYLSTFSIQRKNEAGEVVSITGSSQNITEKVMNREALAKSKEQAERASQAKSQFLSRMSHELRTPLNAILGFSQLIKMNSQGLTGQQKENLDHVLNAGNYLLKLINEVLDLNIIESGEFSFTKENLNISLVMEELIAQMQPFTKEKNIRIVNHLSRKDSYFIRADNKAFTQIILNLLNNAVKYNHEGGSITVEAGVSGRNQIWISVADTGLGISNENMGKLFEPFNRLGQENGAIEGIGIGLSISKRLAESMGGELSAECELGKGCCFKLVMPTGIGESVNINTSHLDSDPAKSDSLSKGHKILYIEDNHQNLTLVQQILGSRSQMELLSAMDPRDGIELARIHRPDLILMDMQLPNMDGISAFRELQKLQETRDIPVIAISAQAMKDDIRKALSAGFKDYIIKPIDIQDFLEKIDKILNPEVHHCTP